MGLLLTAADINGPLRWRWLLTSEQTGAPLADHQVNLDPESDDVARFRDLYSYAHSYAAPDRRTEDGTRIVAEAGAWAGRALLGAAVTAAIARAARSGPVTVRVTAPPPADGVLLWPLELAQAGGKPLAALGDVTFLYDLGANGDPPAAAAPEPAGRLRVLAVFSQPTRTSVLALRRERYALTRRFRRIAARENAALELRVVQYGVTRDQLKRIAEDGEGWDVLHLSGHGAGGAFLLEHPDGAPDVVSAADLVRLLRPVRPRVKLAVVSACQSAADATAQAYRLLGLTGQAQALEAEWAGDAAAPKIPGLARALVDELDCAVVAMRYPVTDEFAIAYGDELYERLLSHGQSLDVAAARALREAAGETPSPARPATSLATPGVFGARAAGLRLTLPRARPDLGTADLKMAYFPDEPARFVGRAEAMARASAVLAPDSGQTAVLLHGMAGAGKTACALELAYRHENAFNALAFWQAPTKDEEWPSALPDLASRLEIQLGDRGFTMASHIGTQASLERFLPRLRQLMRSSGILLVLDNLESLLTADGTWRDPRWGLLIAALTSHDGESRVILTARTAPAALLTADSGRTLPVHALSLSESVALARELPNLRALLHADPGPDRPATERRGGEAQAEDDRDRVRRVLRVVQGHPKLMELADAAAADRDQLDTQLTEAEAAAVTDARSAGSLEAFFRTGESPLAPAQFLGTLSAWTASALAALPPEVRLMAEFTACLEDGDRRSDVIAATWPNLWQHLSGPEGGLPPSPARDPGDVPFLEPLLSALAVAALVETEAVSVDDAVGDARAGDSPALVTYRMHPGVASAVAATAQPGMRAVVDGVLAAHWHAVSDWARNREGGEDGALVVRAGLAAAPYLLRRGDWDNAAFLLEQAVMRDEAPRTTQAVLPSLRRIAAATGKPKDVAGLAWALAGVDVGEAERLLRGAIDAAAGSDDYRVASAATLRLMHLLMRTGRSAEALAVGEQRAEYTRRAGLGLWTQMSDQAQRLHVLAELGDHAEVLEEVDRLRTAMKALPDRRGPDDTVEPWSVRELILGAGYASALATEQWERCLEMCAEVVASVRQRDAGTHEIARFRFNAARPLMELGQLDEAARLLSECQRVYEEHGDISHLPQVLSVRGDLESRLGHLTVAADLERAALRLYYARPEPGDIAISHHNLANLLLELGGDWAQQRAHRLGAALVFGLIGMRYYLDVVVRDLAADIYDLGEDPSLPATVAQVAESAERAEGVRLGALLVALQPDHAAIEEALAEILRTARAAVAALASAPADLPRD
jgi:tetratricopeptide (TPR) repeat protein